MDTRGSKSEDADFFLFVGANTLVVSLIPYSPHPPSPFFCNNGAISSVTCCPELCLVFSCIFTYILYISFFRIVCGCRNETNRIWSVLHGIPAHQCKGVLKHVTPSKEGELWVGTIFSGTSLHVKTDKKIVRIFITTPRCWVFFFGPLLFCTHIEL